MGGAAKWSERSRRGLDGRTDGHTVPRLYGDLAFYGSGIGRRRLSHAKISRSRFGRAAIHKGRLPPPPRPAARQASLRNVVVVVVVRKRDRRLGFIDEIHLAKER